MALKTITHRMLETQAQRCRIGFKPVDYHRQDWTTTEQPNDVYVLATDGLRVTMKYHRTGWEIQSAEISSDYDISDRIVVTGELRRT